MIYCLHGKRKYQCITCGNSANFCLHGKRKARCRDCGGSSFCEHGKEKRRCRKCGGSDFCEHGRRKVSYSTGIHNKRLAAVSVEEVRSASTKFLNKIARFAQDLAYMVDCANGVKIVGVLRFALTERGSILASSASS
jgi:hypothetical protein